MNWKRILFVSFICSVFFVPAVLAFGFAGVFVGFSIGVALVILMNELKHKDTQHDGD